MLYYFFRFLEKWDIPGSGMWSYISFRALLALILSLIISIWFGEYFIKWMKRHNATEAQRDKSIDPYGVEKKGVPTMGGVIILIATIVPCLLFGRLRNIYMILMLVTTVWLGAIGFADDYIKMKITKDGLRPIYKLIGQAALGLIVGLTLWASPDAVIRENVSLQRQGTESVVYKSEPVKSTVTTIPFVKNNNLDYLNAFSWISDGKTKRACGWILFIIITTFVITAVSNGANLNDGMDGMCAGNSAIIGTALGILAYVSGHIQFASYLNVMFTSGSMHSRPRCSWATPDLLPSVVSSPSQRSSSTRSCSCQSSAESSSWRASRSSCRSCMPNTATSRERNSGCSSAHLSTTISGSPRANSFQVPSTSSKSQVQRSMRI